MPSIDVLDSTVNYREIGSGTPFVFLHGNPTSSHLWRKVLAAFGPPGHLLAPDLIGMGDSGKPDIDYTFADHARYLDAWFDALGLDGVVLVGHDWGGALAFDWATRHPKRVAGIAFTETIVKPMEWAEFPEGGREMFETLKGPGGEAMILDQNMFIEQVLPYTVAQPLAEADLREYARPYPTRESRRPMLAWPRAMPLGGQPADVVERVRAYDDWLSRSADVPKLFMMFEAGPGAMMGPEMSQWCVDNFASLEVTRHGVAGHHTPEDQPEAIAKAVREWADKHQLCG